MSQRRHSVGLFFFENQTDRGTRYLAGAERLAVLRRDTFELVERLVEHIGAAGQDVGVAGACRRQRRADEPQRLEAFETHRQIPARLRKPRSVSVTAAERVALAAPAQVTCSTLTTLLSILSQRGSRSATAISTAARPRHRTVVAFNRSASPSLRLAFMKLVISKTPMLV